MVIFLVVIIMMFSSSTGFDLMNFNCSSPFTEVDDSLEIRSCTFLPSTTITDASQLSFVSSMKTSQQEDCCSQCSSIDCDFFLIINLEMGQYECNFYSVANSSTEIQINLCSNTDLVTGFPAITQLSQ